jgi:hypothetical protein
MYTLLGANKGHSSDPTNEHACGTIHLAVRDTPMVRRIFLIYGKRWRILIIQRA